MNRRDFLKVSVAAAIATQVPDVAEAKDKAEAGQLLMKPDEHIAYIDFPGVPLVRRRVIFLMEHNPDEAVSATLGPPPIGTIVAGEAKNGTLRAYCVVENLDVEVIPTVVSYWDKNIHNSKVGTTYFGYVAIVESIAPAFGDQHDTIRRILTPNTGFSIVCENWRVERYGGDPNHPALALDAFNPSLVERAVKAGLMPVWKRNA